MAVILVIPARYASARFPGKPLAELRGATGEARSLIRRTWDAACAVPEADRVLVATDSAEIARAVEAFGGEIMMTPDTARNGTERCAMVAAEICREADIVVNLQGDAPLTPPWFVSDLVAAMRTDPDAAVATPVLRCDSEALESFRADRRAGRVGATTVVFGQGGAALYFSKEIVPFTGDGPDISGPIPVFHHVGVYAYTSAALRSYRDHSPGVLERAEGLEQLRFLENGIGVRCVEVESRGRVFWEVNNPEDIPRVEAVLARLGMP